MQHCMIWNDTARERNLQRDRVGIARVHCDMPVLGHHGVIDRDDQALFPALDPHLLWRIRESDVSRA